MSEVKLGRVMVLGSKGMVGSALIRGLKKMSGVSEIISVCREQLDLTNQRDTFTYIASKAPDCVIIAAAKVGGIHANSSNPKDFIYENLAIELNAIEASYRAGVEKLIFLGSSCIYPKFSTQPIREESLLTAALEPTNEPYAIAKIAGIKLCDAYNRQCGTDYRSLMPTNLYGPGDNFHPFNSHVIPGMIRRFHEAKLNNDKTVEVWGTGKVRREFLFVDDLVDAVLHIIRLEKTLIDAISSDEGSHINVGTGSDITISELAILIKNRVGFGGDLHFDASKPDGTPRKLLDSSRLASTGWQAQTQLCKGLSITYDDFKVNMSLSKTL